MALSLAIAPGTAAPGAASTGSTATGPAATSAAASGPAVPGAAARAGTAPGAPAFGPPVPGTTTRRRAAAIGRAVLIGGPVLLLVWALLTAADPIFWSWFDLPSAAEHVILILTGAWAVTGLARAASAREPSPPLCPAPRLGAVEAGFLLGGLCALYTAFVAAQFVALSAAGHRILAARGLNYSQYARSGFFQLLACAAITMLVLLIVRACARPHLWLTALYVLAAILTIGVVITAIRRLNLYVAADGLTMLRLSCLVAATWIGVVFAMIALSTARGGLPRRYLPAAILISALVFTVGWGIANPAAIVARVNLSRAAHGHPLEVSQAASLGPDAMPTLLSGLRDLTPARARHLRLALCAAEPPADSAADFNMSVTGARSAVTQAGCAGLRRYLAQQAGPGAPPSARPPVQPPPATGP
jgi:hypothetical protein